MSVTTQTRTELWRMSATELAEAIRIKEASSVQVVEAHLRAPLPEELKTEPPSPVAVARVLHQLERGELDASDWHATHR